MPLARPVRPFFILLLLASLLTAVGCGEQGSSPEQTPEDNTEAMSKEHEGDEPESSPATVPEPAVPVVAQRVTYGTVEGAEVTGYMARPESAQEGLPGLIVIQEWWGLNENIEAMTRRLAGEGYVALAVDLYDGQIATTPDEARAMITAARETPGKLDEHLQAAYRWLEGQGAPRIGSIGWCFGGGLSLRTALLHPEDLDAAVIYYGRVVTDPEELAPLKVPVLGLFGAEDQGIPVDGVRAFEKALTDLGQQPIVHIYENADHAFANPSGTRYNAEVADRAWSETLTFFETHLKSQI